MVALDGSEPFEIHGLGSGKRFPVFRWTGPFFMAPEQGYDALGSFLWPNLSAAFSSRKADHHSAFFFNH
jgi:hypothetical protein